MMTPIVIHTEKLVFLDNTVLSNFAYVRRSDLITKLWKNCATTPQAWGELQKGISTKKSVAGQWDGLALLSLCDEEVAFWQTLPKMGDGESSCLAMAYYRQAIFATDDSKARAVGLKLGLEISGTIGFLLFAVAKRTVAKSEANVLLRKMVANGYRSPVKDLGEI
jgi:predicted nucleic acid-binding protein